jgi:hypothetical protein
MAKQFSLPKKRQAVYLVFSKQASSQEKAAYYV